jgi:type II secretory pathway pseudopilin PulG
MARRLLVVLLLAMFAAPTMPAQTAIAEDRPVADHQIAAAEGVLAQQRQIACAPLAQDDPGDFTALNALTQLWSQGQASVIWANSPRVIAAATHHILPPLRGPPAV